MPPAFRTLSYLFLSIVSGYQAAVLATEQAHVKRPLNDVLLDLAKQHNVQIMFVPRLLKSFKAAPQEQYKNIETALSQQLEGLPLTFLKVADRVYIIQRTTKKRSPTKRQTLAVSQPESQQPVERIRVIGSHIIPTQLHQRSQVRMFDSQFIHGSGALSANELFSSIPQVGEIFFNNERSIGGINDARGDVSSINLKGLGTGYTLTLLNGRRMVMHPASQTENFVPMATVNNNAIPSQGLSRVEVLLDGASALYGSDAVAGVVNYVFPEQLQERSFKLDWGKNTKTGLSHQLFSLNSAITFNKQNSFVNWSLWQYWRQGIDAIDSDFSQSQDRRFHSGLNERFVGDSQLDNRSISTPWVELYSADQGNFHLRPTVLEGCNHFISPSEQLCFANGTTPQALKYDRAVEQSMTSDVERTNAYVYLLHQIKPTIDFFSELFLYKSSSKRYREQSGILGSQRFRISEDAYYNPLNEPLLLYRYRPIDAGPRKIKVDNYNYRIVSGLKGYRNGWDWDSAILYSASTSKDIAHNRIQASAFQQAVNSSDVNLAYDLFNGADRQYPNTQDSTVNSLEVLESFRVDPKRLSKSDLFSLDVRVSNPEFIQINNWNIALGLGAEWRRESYRDDRDALLDGSSPFVDELTGEILNYSDLLGSSHTLDSSGSQKVASAYIETIASLNDQWSIQLAARAEEYSNFGGVLKPKVALSWQVLPDTGLRLAYSEGFKAPALVQIAEQGVGRVNSNEDPLTGNRYGMQEIRTGNQFLKPETNNNWSFGITSKLLPGFHISADLWRIRQQKVIGILPAQTILLDNALNQVLGVADSRVERDLHGSVVKIHNQYLNLNPRNIIGIDYQLNMQGGEDLLKWQLDVNLAHLLRFDQQRDAISERVIEAQQRGLLAPLHNIFIENVGSLKRIDGRPEWRASLVNTWRYENVLAAISVNYVSGFYDDSVWDSVGELMPVDDHTTVSSYLSAHHKINDQKLTVTIGVRNLFDAQPPVADESFGYFSTVHSNQGRLFFSSVKVTF